MKNLPYYFFNIKNFDPILLNIEKISLKGIDAVIYNIECITVKSINHVNIDSENPPYLIFNNVDGQIEESNGDKYFIFASTHKNKKVLKNYTKLWDEIKNRIKTINNGGPMECKKDFMKIKLESDDDLPSGKLLSISMIIVVDSVLQEENKYYS